jgi:hypothetical protein
MLKTVRFVEDDNPYSAGDFGDQGVEEMARIEAGAVIVVGMVVFDADAVEDEMRTNNTAYETAVHLHSMDSLWCITVQADAINDCDKDFHEHNLGNVQNDYLRHLAADALGVG